MSEMKAEGKGKSPALNNNKADLPEWVGVIGELAEQKREAEESPEIKGNNRNHLAVSSGLYMLVIRRIEELQKYSDKKSGIVRFPAVFKKLCTSLQINKNQCWELLFLFKDLGLLEIVPFQGIRMRKGKNPAEILL